MDKQLCLEKDVKREDKEGKRKLRYNYHDTGNTTHGDASSSQLSDRSQETTGHEVESMEKLLGAATCEKGERKWNGEMEPNQDVYFVNRGRGFFGVFDGMGGLQDGHIAAKIVKDHIEDSLAKLFNPMSREEARTALENIFVSAHNELVKEEIKDGFPHAMGTTGTVSIITNDGYLVTASVGDSRAYRFPQSQSWLGWNRAGTIDHLTLDDIKCLSNNNIDKCREQKKFANLNEFNKKITSIGII